MFLKTLRRKDSAVHNHLTGAPSYFSPNVFCYVCAIVIIYICFLEILHKLFSHRAASISSGNFLAAFAVNAFGGYDSRYPQFLLPCPADLCFLARLDAFLPFPPNAGH
jgi:hypothetical protein